MSAFLQLVGRRAGGVDRTTGSTSVVDDEQSLPTPQLPAAGEANPSRRMPPAVPMAAAAVHESKLEHGPASSAAPSTTPARSTAPAAELAVEKVAEEKKKMRRRVLGMLLVQ